MTDWLNWLVSFGWVPEWIKNLDPLLGVGGAVLGALLWYYNFRKRPALIRQVTRLDAMLRYVDLIRRDPEAMKRWEQGRSRPIVTIMIAAALVAFAAVFVSSPAWLWIIAGLEGLLGYLLFRLVRWTSRVNLAVREWPHVPAQWIHDLVEVRMRREGDFSDQEWARTVNRLFEAAGNDEQLKNIVLRKALS